MIRGLEGVVDEHENIEDEGPLRHRSDSLASTRTQLDPSVRDAPRAPLSAPSASSASSASSHKWSGGSVIGASSTRRRARRLRGRSPRSELPALELRDRFFERATFLVAAGLGPESLVGLHCEVEGERIVLRSGNACRIIRQRRARELV